MLLLTGSHALKVYGRLYDREPYDYDFITYGSSYRKTIDQTLIEVSGTDKEYFVTNKDILDYCKTYEQLIEVNTPIGIAVVAPLPILKLLKLSCKDYLNKPKHEWDLKYLEDITLNEILQNLLSLRQKETEERVSKQKDQFFNKYTIERHIDHDKLHLLINVKPTYLKALHNEYEISPLKFNALSNNDKVNMIREEAFVLALERFLIPRVKDFVFIKSYLYRKFNEFKTSQSVPYKTISRLCVPGMLQDHPEWIAQWANQNNQLILNDLQTWWLNQFDKVKPWLEELVNGGK